MNAKDKEVFEKFLFEEEKHIEDEDYHLVANFMRLAWEACCEYKQKEITALAKIRGEE